MRKVYINVQARIIVQAEEDVDISEVISEMDYNFTSITDNAEIVDSEIVDYEVTDSK